MQDGDIDLLAKAALILAGIFATLSCWLGNEPPAPCLGRHEILSPLRQCGRRRRMMKAWLLRGLQRSKT